MDATTAVASDRPHAAHLGAGNGQVGSITKRFRWEEIKPFPGNPVLDTRLDLMVRRWGGYLSQVVGIPLVADNAAGAFPEYPADAIVMVNGHHRQALAIRYKRERENVICELLRGRERDELHRIFRQVNDARQVSQAEKFLHRVGEGESRACEINAILEREGFHVILGSGSHDGIQATQSCEWIWGGGDPWLRRHRGKGPHRDALTLALKGYRALIEGQKIVKQGAMLKGLGAFFIRYPEADYGRLIQHLGAKYETPRELMAAAKQAREDYRFATAHEGFGFIARLHYNGRRGSGGQLAEWRAL